jgi:hypothetical protein
MSVTLTFEQLATIGGGLAGLFLIVWRARPYVQGEVQKENCTHGAKSP